MNQAASTGRWARHGVLAGIVLLSLALRAIAALQQGDAVAPLPGVADQLSYHKLALRVAGGHGFTLDTPWWPATPANEPTAHWSYLYVLFLAAVYALLGAVPLIARLLQCAIVGVLHPVLTYRIGNRLFGRRVALVSAVLAACYAYFVYYAGSLMTESLYIVAILCSIDTAQRLAGPAEGRRPAGLGAWFQLGVALSAAVLLRQVMLLMVPLVLAWIVRQRRLAANPGEGPRSGSARWIGGVAVTTSVLVASIAPWTVRNYRAFHVFVPLNTNAGFAFYWGNHPIHGSRFIPILPGDGSAYGRLIPATLLELNEAELDKALLRLGLGFVSEDPARYLLLSVSRLEEYLRFWPSRDAGRASNLARTVSFGICLPFFAAGVVLASCTRRPNGKGPAHADPGLLLWFVGAYSLIHCLTWTLVRYRLPVDALLIPFAALSMVRLCSFARPRQPVGGTGSAL